MRYLFICVHPDDLEFACSNLMKDLISRGKDVHVLSFTRGEFGVFLDEWKGPRLAKIRTREFYKASALHGIPQENVHFGDIIDGFVRPSKQTIDNFVDWLNELTPDIIFAPEFYYTYYWHSDHINCGLMVNYLLTKQMKRLSFSPRSLYHYTTLKSTFRWPIPNLQHTVRGLDAHRSQQIFMTQIKAMNYPDKFRIWLKTLKMWTFSEGFRRAHINSPPTHPTLLERAFYGIISKFHVIDPPEDHYILKGHNSEFAKEIQRLREKYKFRS